MWFWWIFLLYDSLLDLNFRDIFGLRGCNFLFETHEFFTSRWHCRVCVKILVLLLLLTVWSCSATLAFGWSNRSMRLCVDLIIRPFWIGFSFAVNYLSQSHFSLLSTPIEFWQLYVCSCAYHACISSPFILRLLFSLSSHFFWYID